MDAELKAKWVEALRSGKYKQTVRCLRDPAGEVGGGFCCLGVLAEVKGVEWEECTPYVAGKMVCHKEGGWLSEEFSGLHFSEQKSLSRMNDSDVPFDKIADYIEQNL
jgi:hypothetical protein